MLSMLRKRMQDDKGFTLIELMVVVLIIAILIAIAIPTFLGLRTRSQNRAAQSDLRNGMTAAKSFYTDKDAYTGFNAAEAKKIETSLDWVDSGTPAKGQVGVAGVTAQEVVLNGTSASGQAYCIADQAGSTGKGTVRGEVHATSWVACDGATDW